MRPRYLLLVALLLAAPVAAAGPLTAGQAQAAEARVEGDLTLFQVADVSGALGPASPAPWMTVSASHVQVHLYEHQVLMAGGTGFEIPDPSDGQPVASFEDSDVTVWTTHVDPSFRVQVISAGAAVSGNVSGAAFESVPSVYLNGQGVGAHEPGQTQSQGGAWFSQVWLDEPHVITHADGVTSIEIVGDLVLEATEIHFTIEGDDGTTSADSRGATDRLTGIRTGRLVRMTFDDALIVYSGGGVRHEWAGPSPVDVAARSLVLTDAVGLLGDDELAHERVSVPGGGLLAPQDDRLAVAPAADLATPSGWTEGMGRMLAIAGLLVIPVGLGLGIRQVRVPNLDQVEAALEAGHYGKAARMARRIIRREPGLEGAWISRGIALTKAGDAWRAAEELSDYLETHAPSDGVIHYVLGTALMEIGREDSARRAFENAVTRTPSLGATPVGAQAYS